MNMIAVAFLISVLVAFAFGIFIGFLIGFSKAMREAAGPFQSKSRIIGGYCFLFSAIAMFIAALFFAFSSWFFIRSAVPSEGTVIQLRERHDADGNSSYAPVVSFKDTDNLMHTIEAHSYSFPPGHHVGDTLPVLYQRDHPEKGRINDFLETWGLAVFLGGFSIVEAMVGVVLLWSRIKSSKALQHLTRKIYD